jgi:hypothetical protein
MACCDECKLRREVVRALFGMAVENTGYDCGSHFKLLHSELSRLLQRLADLEKPPGSEALGGRRT